MDPSESHRLEKKKVKSRKACSQSGSTVMVMTSNTQLVPQGQVPVYHYKGLNDSSCSPGHIL